MSNLGTLASQVTVGVQRLGQRTELLAQLRRIDNTAKSISDLTERLNNLTQAVAVCRTAGFAPTMPDASREVAALTTLTAQLAAGDVDQEFARPIFASVEVVLRAGNEAVLSAWRGHISRCIPAQDGLLVLADAFNTVDGASRQADRLRSATRSVHTFSQQAPTADAVVKLDQLSKEIPELLRQLVGEDPDVRAFAEQLARGGAAIGMLTPTVLRWMQDTGFAGSFKIVGGRPAGRDPR